MTFPGIFVIEKLHVSDFNRPAFGAFGAAPLDVGEGLVSVQGDFANFTVVDLHDLVAPLELTHGGDDGGGAEDLLDMTRIAFQCGCGMVLQDTWLIRVRFFLMSFSKLGN